MSGFFYFPAILLIWLCGPRQYACPLKRLRRVLFSARSGQHQASGSCARFAPEAPLKAHHDQQDRQNNSDNDGRPAKRETL
jgi:hypothetical protein